MDGATFLWFAAGLVLLVAGAELLVRGASRLAGAFGISPLVIGLTVVAYGTSTPELAVAVQAGFDGRADLAVGNVVGSNVFNILFILGTCAAIAPLVVQAQVVRREVPIMIGASLLAALLGIDGRYGMLDGALLTAGIAFYSVSSIVQSRRESKAVQEEYAHEFGAPAAGHGGGLAVQVALIAVGLVLLILGARWLVHSAVTVAQALGVSEVVIGLTIVAAGTSLPEVAASLVATLRGERDIAIGNVIGSNIYNVLAILGIASLVTPGGLSVAPSIQTFDGPVMIAVALACLPLFFTGRRVARWEGLLFLAYYFAYAAYLVLDAVGHDALPAYSAVMLEFTMPLTAITIAVVTFRELRAHRGGGGGPDPASRA
ncbi:MAG: sodium:calcium antiporter [Proteobacteria bacterium]|nr:MAG: sodium:calcium antiporter [Pseudomonadota bacterium]